MIYFDNAATSWPKPLGVLESMQKYLRENGANPGRSGHKMSVAANEIVEETRELLSTMFKLNKPDRVIFALNATDALNMAIKGLIKPGNHVVTSSMEHNSVTRPLHVLSQQGVNVTKVSCGMDGSIDLKQLESALQEDTKAIVILHASNVVGTLMPLHEIGKIAKQRGITLIVDAAQTAGVFNIDMELMHIDLLAVPGHKGLMGPPGTGVLLLGSNVKLDTLREGGTGSYSDTPGQPEVLPEKYESGTLNTVGIAGLNAGIKWLLKTGLAEIKRHELELAARFLQGARQIKGLTIYGPRDAGKQAAVVSFALKGKDSVDVGGALDKQYNIAARAGLHCAPDAHRTLGTFDRKLVRFSWSYFNTAEEVDSALNALDEISKSDLPKSEGCGC
ncbi:MAG: aminotransferase class V-fold PLP-dependent enzyme [Firmicutes bacterium]|nr:aminotransferase class V-fold PLP-dependent enzyme [Bacillota bacterium]